MKKVEFLQVLKNTMGFEKPLANIPQEGGWLDKKKEIPEKKKSGKFGNWLKKTASVV